MDGSQAEQPLVEPQRMLAVHSAVLSWYAAEGRQLPWRETRDPYAVLVSEVMLQQTQVERVVPKWHAWLARFPSLTAVAEASRADVIRAWSGLGYNLRAVRLHEVARAAVTRFGGELPRTLEGLLDLPGLGRYTAGAVACFAFGQPVAVVDTNVRRVLARVFLGRPQLERREERAVRRLADALLPPDDAYAWNQALMDLGARLCTAARPACLVCPLLAFCAAAPSMAAWPEERRRALRERRSPYAGDRQRAAADQRYYRGRIVEALRQANGVGGLELGDLGPRVKDDFQPSDVAWLEGTVRRLAADGLVICLDDPPLRVRLPD